MDDLAIARALHVLAVLVWIGGVAFVTWIVMPAIRRHDAPPDWLTAFSRIEERFAPRARLWVLLAGATGFWMIYRGEMWYRFAEPGFWWMHAMVGLWCIFAAMLFIIEPFFMRGKTRPGVDPEAKFRRLERMHQLLLFLAVVTLLGTVAGSHGLF